MTDIIKLPAHSVEAEQSVLGSLLQSRAAWHKIQHTIIAEDFYRHDHRLLFEAIARLMTAGEPADVVTVAERLDADGDLGKVGGLPYIAALAENTPTSANVESYAGIVVRHAQTRAAVAIAAELRDSAQDDEAIDKAIRALMLLKVERRNFEHTLDEAVAVALETVDATLAGTLKTVPSGITELDDMLGGFYRGELYIIGARPSVGKTALMLNMIERANRRTAFVSGEQAHEQIGQRMICITGKVDSHRLRTGGLREDDWPLITAAVHGLAKRPVWVYDRSGPTISEVERWARKMKHERDIEILHVDYLQRIRPDNGGRDVKRNYQIEDITQRLKDLARDLEIPVVALAQVNRDCEKRADKRPGLGDLADGSAIEKEADAVITAYRDEVYNKENSDMKGILELAIWKNRHGPTGTVLTAWRGEFMRVENLAHGGI